MGRCFVRLLFPFNIPFYIEFLPTQDELRTFPQASSVIVFWVIGIISLSLFFIASYLRFCKVHKSALPLENDYARKLLSRHKIKRPIKLRQSDRINTPVTYGIFKPVILFPKIKDWHDELWLKHALTHEITHVRHFDILTKWVLAVVLCIHWFNPLVWVMYILANRDIEVACDEAVVLTFGEDTKAAYALTLIGLEERRRGLSSLTVNFAKNATEERIRLIMKTKKRSVFSAVIAVILVSVIALGTLLVNAGDSPAAYYPLVAETEHTLPYSAEETLQRINAPLAEIIEPIFGYTEYQGVRMTLIGARRFNNELLIYLSLQDTTGENRITDTTCFQGFSFGDMPAIGLVPGNFSATTIIYPQIYFDEETNMSYHKILLYVRTAVPNILTLTFSDILLEDTGTATKVLKGNWQVTANMENLSNTPTQRITREIHVSNRIFTSFTLSPLGLQATGHYLNDASLADFAGYNPQPNVYIETAHGLIPIRNFSSGRFHRNFEMQWLTAPAPLNMETVTAIILDGYRIPVTYIVEGTPTRFFYLPATPPADASPTTVCIDSCCTDVSYDILPEIPQEVRALYDVIFTRLLIETFGHDDLQVAYEQLGSEDFAVTMDSFFDKFNSRYGGSHKENSTAESAVPIVPHGPCSVCNGTMVMSEASFAPNMMSVTGCGHGLSDSNLRVNEHWEQWTVREWRCRNCHFSNGPTTVRRTWVSCFRR